MRKYNLNQIMNRAWEIKRQNAMNIFSFCLKMAWAEAKAPRTVTLNVIGKETFTVNAQTGVVTGKTYNSREFLKKNFNAKWDGESRQWTVDVAKFNSELVKYAGYYAKYIVADKVVVFSRLVNKNDGFYSYQQYSDGSHDYVFVG